MDVMRTGVSVLGCVLPEKDDHNQAGAADIADCLLASLGSMLLYWYHFATHGRRIDVEANEAPGEASIASHFLRMLHGQQPSASWVRGLQTSLILYAEHEFNASTFAGRVIAGTGSDLYSSIAGAIGALRGPKHGGANEVALDILKRYATADEAEADIRKRVAAREVIIGFGHPVYTVSDPRHEVIKEVARTLSEEAGEYEALPDRRADRVSDVGDEKNVSQPRLVFRRQLLRHEHSDRDVYAAVCDGAHRGLERARHRAAPRRQDHPACRDLHRPDNRDFVPLQNRT